MYWLTELSEAWRREHGPVDASALVPLTYVARLGVLVDRFQEEVLDPFELSPSDYSVLATLRRAGDPYRLKPSQLYSELQRSSGGMTKILKRLEARRLIERESDPDDGRGSLVQLTEAGRALQERAFLSFVVAAEKRLAPLTLPGRAFSEKGLRALIEAFEVTQS